MKLDRLLRKLEQDYAQEKAGEAEELHNGIVQVIAEHKAEIQTILYVLEMVKFEVLRERYEQLFKAATNEPKPGTIKLGNSKE